MIVSLLKQKDKEAIPILYDQYASALYGVILKIVGSQQIAEDVLQETFIKIWRNGDQYDPKKGRLFTWLLNIARNTAIDKRRSAGFKKNSKNQLLESSVYYREGLTTSNNPDHIGLRELVDGLDEKYRQILELVYFKGFTQSEVVKELNIPLGTVKSRTRIALRELRKLFETHKVIFIVVFWLFLII